MDLNPTVGLTAAHTPVCRETLIPGPPSSLMSSGGCTPEHSVSDAVYTTFVTEPDRPQTTFPSTQWLESDVCEAGEAGILLSGWTGVACA